MGAGHEHPQGARDEDGAADLSRRDIVRGISGCGIAAMASGCAYNEDLGPSELLFVSSDQMAQLAQVAWNDVKRHETASRNQSDINRVQRVAEKIITAGGEDPARWDVKVFQSDQLNAFALPGGKIGVYSGILDLVDSDDQIAALLGHGYAHVRYNHAGERFSQTSLAKPGSTIAQVLRDSEADGAEIKAVLGLGVNGADHLPFSRKHELEADKFGLRYMNRAGYSPDEAVQFWLKMASASADRLPEVLSTHPADTARLRALEREIELLPPIRER